MSIIGFILETKQPHKPSLSGSGGANVLLLNGFIELFIEETQHRRDFVTTTFWTAKSLALPLIIFNLLHPPQANDNQVFPSWVGPMRQHDCTGTINKDYSYLFNLQADHCLVRGSYQELCWLFFWERWVVLQLKGGHSLSAELYIHIIFLRLLSQKKLLSHELAWPSSDIQMFPASVRSQGKGSARCRFEVCFIDVSLLP